MQLNFDNSYLREFAAGCRRVQPSGFEHPRLVSFNPDAAKLINLTPRMLRSPEFLAFASGQRPVTGCEPVAQVYSGHQFGDYVPRLGDGRGLLLGEVRNARGEKWDLHLKGAGQTPYSRHGDGRAVLRSTVREYLASEALHHLGIPSSRALCVVSSDEPVMRERVETGAMLIRLAQSHIRFGHFEYFYHRGEHVALRQLADYLRRHHFPHCAGTPEGLAEMFATIVHRTATLIAKWQAFGFAHGVMNTDNMSVLGITFDFGPFGFMDDYDPGYVCNHSDYQGRYAFDRQPEVGYWNLQRLAQVFSPLVSRTDLAAALETYDGVLIDHYRELMRSRLGLQLWCEGDRELLGDLLKQMHEEQLDYHRVFRALCHFRADPGAIPPSDETELSGMFKDKGRHLVWAARYRQRLRQQWWADSLRSTRMLISNPKFILRNYLAQQAIALAEQGNFREVNRLLALLRRPYAEQPGYECYAASPPLWGKSLEISCSS